MKFFDLFSHFSQADSKIDNQKIKDLCDLLYFFLYFIAENMNSHQKIFVFLVLNRTNSQDKGIFLSIEKYTKIKIIEMAKSIILYKKQAYCLL